MERSAKNQEKLYRFFLVVWSKTKEREMRKEYGQGYL
jgi:hypothetical protein